MIYLLKIPIKTPGTKRKPHPLNLNFYRNAHYRTLHKMKVDYEILTQNQVARLPPLQRISLHYVLFPGSFQKVDISNVLSIVDKFFTDVLVHQGIIPDDSYDHVIQVSYSFGSITKGDPHVMVMVADEIPQPRTKGAR